MTAFWFTGGLVALVMALELLESGVIIIVVEGGS